VLTELLFEEAEESAAGGFEGALLLLRIAVIQQWSSLLQNLEEEIFDGHFPEARGFVQVADDFSSQHPKVELQHRFPRHHQRQQRLSGDGRLRFGDRLGKPERERPDQRPDQHHWHSWLRPYSLAHFGLGDARQLGNLHHYQHGDERL